ncbi:MAG: hypothetical protein KY464_03930 [Gemmatimonadetes bacterium]|nr:hypothetical protein [Gemmatimonadota bacterium]
MIDRIPFVPRRGRPGAPSVFLGALLTLGLAACEFPTELPKWDTTWIVPAESTTISVTRLLPSSITTGAGGTSFVLDLQPVTVSRTLAEICGSPCALANGLIVPKPRFETAFGTSISLPAEVVFAQVTGGSVRIALTHDFSFDPIRPSASARGFIVVTATAGTAVIGRDSIAGENTAFAAGTTLNRVLTLSATNVTGPIAINVRLNSPAGDPVTIDTSDRLSLTATPTQIQLSQAQIRVSNRTIDATEVELDLGDIDEAVTENVKGGALLLSLANPFTVTGNLSAVITAPGTTITKAIPLAQGFSSVRVEFNQQEIQSILGASPVRLRVSGSVCGSAPCTPTVTPTQSVTIASRLELTIGPKGN